MQTPKFVVAITRGSKTNFYYAYSQAQLSSYLAKKWKAGAKAEIATLKQMGITTCVGSVKPGLWEKVKCTPNKQKKNS